MAAALRAAAEEGLDGAVPVSLAGGERGQKVWDRSADGDAAAAADDDDGAAAAVAAAADDDADDGAAPSPPEMSAVRQTWRAWLAVRDAPSPAHPHRYADLQLRYHYTGERALLVQAVEAHRKSSSTRISAFAALSGNEMN
jgi:hypothetical protein